MKNHLSIYFLLVIIFLFGIVIFEMFSPFLVTMLTAFVFWQLFQAPYNYLEKKLKNSQISSFLVCSLVLLLIIIPFSFIISTAAQEALSIYQNIGKEAESISQIQLQLQSKIERQASDIGLSKDFQGIFNQINLSQPIQKIASFTADLLQNASIQLTQFILLVILMLVTLYYLFLDGNRFLKYLFHISPLTKKDETKLLQRFVSMSRAALKGGLVIAIIQGFVGGFTFWLLGIESPLFWGLIMGLTSIIPIFGSAVVWIPAAIWMFFNGFVLQGLIIVAVGSIVIGGVENLLRPRLVGKETSVHPMLVLFSTLGGINEFGIMGFLVGPILLTIFIALLEIFEKNFHDKLKKLDGK